jgi:hypothetical protein
VCRGVLGRWMGGGVASGCGLGRELVELASVCMYGVTGRTGAEEEGEEGGGVEDVAHGCGGARVEGVCWGRERVEDRAEAFGSAWVVCGRSGRRLGGLV